MFCMATAVSEGSGPNPAPIKISVSSNDSGVRLSARHPSDMTAPIEISSAPMGSSL
jgi:hypothetical protein